MPPEIQWPADHVERRPISELQAYARNARTHSPEQVDQIKASMLEWGWTAPVLVDELGVLIAGHGRILAALQLGYDTVPVMTARGWTEEQKNAYRIADNQIPLNAGWDPKLLRLELQDLKLAGFDLGLTAIGQVELVSFLADKKRDPEETPEPELVPITRAGDVWLLGRHRLVCGDCTDAAVVAVANGNLYPKLMDTDPPYGVNYDPTWRRNIRGQIKDVRATGQVQNDHEADWTLAWKLFKGDVAYVWHGALHAGEVEANLKDADFEIRSQIIWGKPSFAISRGDYHWQHEPCFYAVRKGRPGGFVGDRSQSTLWLFPGRNPMGRGVETKADEFTGHGAQKPVEAMKRPIDNNTREGDVVYDPFVGSGTTIIACELTARRCVAIDVDPIYCDVSVRRWQGFTNLHATHEADGRSFAEVAAERLAAPARPRRRQSEDAGEAVPKV